MADTKEKLVEILRRTRYEYRRYIGMKDMEKRMARTEEEFLAIDDSIVGEIPFCADHLIANGVTVADNNVAAKTECEYCQQFDDPCGVPMIAEEESEADRGIYLYNGFLCANGGEFCEAKVNFCPMCGRKLAEPPKGE